MYDGRMSPSAFLTRACLPALLTLLAAAASTTIAWASPPSSARGIYVTVDEDVTSYECYLSTTPSCPLPLSHTTEPSQSVAGGHAPLDDGISTPLGLLTQTSTQNPTLMTAAGQVELQATFGFDCVGLPDECPYPLVVRTHTGYGGAFARSAFRFDEPGQIHLTGTVSLDTDSYDWELMFAESPTGDFLIEVVPADGGPLIYRTLGGARSNFPNPVYTYDEIIDVPAGIYELRFSAWAEVGIELFPGAGGFRGSDMRIDYDLNAQAQSAVPIPVTTIPVQLLLGVLLGGMGTWRIVRRK